MDSKNEISEFPTSRRGRISPDDAGLVSYGPRRVPGLRREEVAVLAGVSVPYYTRLERGNVSGVSDGVLEAIARALQLDDAERAHLVDLARAVEPVPSRPRKRSRQSVRSDVQWTLDALTGAGAVIGNSRLDVLGANDLGRAPFTDSHTGGGPPANSARFTFLDPRAEVLFPEWDLVATETVAILRSAAGRDPFDRELSDLVGELSMQSTEFRKRWATHNVRFHNSGVKKFDHPVVGEMSLNFNRLDVAADQDLAIFTYTAEPGSKSDEALRLLDSWAATEDGHFLNPAPLVAEGPCQYLPQQGLSLSPCEWFHECHDN